MSEESPSYSILLNGKEAADYFTILQTSRHVRQQLGTFQVSLDDWNFETWAGLDKWQPVIIGINGTRIFKGRIDKVIQHYDKKQDGYLTTVSGRDDAGALQDVTFSKYYNLLRGSITTPKELLEDLFTNVYPGRKGTKDPALTLSTSTNFEGHPTSTPSGVFNWDRISFWQALEDVCQSIEGAYSTEPFFLDFWVDENDVTHVTQTGELDLGIDVGGYGGDYIKTRDWTLDGLPIKNDIWFWGGNQAGVLPLETDSSWCTYHSKVVSDPWTAGTAQYFGSLWSNPAPETHMEITNGSHGIHIHFGTLGLQNAVMGGSPTGEPDPFLQGPDAPPYFGWEIDMRTRSFGPDTTSFKVFRRGPNGHLNLYNNDVTDESMGQISQINCSVKASGFGGSFNMVLVLIDGQTPNPSAAISPIVPYTQFVQNAVGVPTKALTPLWGTMRFPIGPSVGGTVQGTGPYNWNLANLPEYLAPTFFDWSDVVRIQFIVLPPPSLLGSVIGTFDIDFDGLNFTKPLVAQGTPIPTDSVHSAFVTDTTVGGILGYERAVNLTNKYRATLAEPQSYVDYLIFGRPDLQVGYTFKAEDEKLLIRESLTGATKSGGYVTSVKAWKPQPS